MIYDGVANILRKKQHKHDKLVTGAVGMFGFVFRVGRARVAQTGAGHVARHAVLSTL